MLCALLMSSASDLEEDLLKTGGFKVWIYAMRDGLYLPFYYVFIPAVHRRFCMCVVGGELESRCATVEYFVASSARFAS